jgi:PAS domain S-box-containing protein
MIPGLRARERYLAAAAFAALLIACAFLLFRLYDERQAVLADFRRGTWIAVQAQSEYLRLGEALARYEAEPGAETRREMLHRLDIFWSRLPVIAEGAEGESVRRLPGVPDLIAQLIGRLPALEAVLNGTEPGDAGSFFTARTLLESYRAPLQTLVLEALHNEGYALSRDRIERQYTWIMIALVAMLASGAVLVLVLRREARNAKANYEKARLAEAEASDVKERLIDAIESISEGFILLDDAGRVLIANNRYRELYPTIADLVEPGVAFSDLVWASAVLEQFDTDQPVEQVVHDRLERLADPHGPFEQALSDGRTLLVSERRTGRGSLVSVHTDVTELKRTQIVLQSRLAAMEASIDGIAIIDVSDRLVGVNKAFAAIFGHASAEVLMGRGWSTLFDDAENARFETDIQPKLHAAGRWRGERTARRADGTQFPLEASMTMLEDGGMVCIVRDVTEQHQAAAERQQLQDQFHQAQKMEALGRLSGGIAHDFNNILAAIIGYATFLTEDLPDGSEPRDFARQVLAAGNRAKDLVQQILAFSRTSDTRHDPIDVVAVVNETLTMLWATMPATVSLTGRIDSDHIIIKGDTTQIGQVLMNLCVNARDALADDRGAITVELARVEIDGGCATGLETSEPTPGKPVLRLRSDTDGRRHRMWVGVLPGPGLCARLSVRDTGVGMDRATMERMFEPFFTTKSVGKGTGLGLAAVHGIVAAHGGAITVESIQGEGTTFQILLPVAAGSLSEAAGSLTSATARGRELVLLVEDEVPVAAMMTHCLERLGYEVASCDHPKDALDTFAEDPDAWDVVVTDQTMPGLTGMELARRLLERRPDLPIVLCTGFSEAANEETARAAGIAAFLNKPVDPDKLAATVRAVLDRQAPDGLVSAPPRLPASTPA